ncbi:MAG: hypothetical protein L0G22_00760, partial [Propionibacteriaceae bacterium]|nr:hypothetical protein [Propionibacteriaceae bacterium]
MRPDVARWLVSDAARPVLAVAAEEADPASLAAATRLRALVEPDRAAAVLSQVTLRRRPPPQHRPPPPEKIIKTKTQQHAH